MDLNPGTCENNSWQRPNQTLHGMLQILDVVSLIRDLYNPTRNLSLHILRGIPFILWSCRDSAVFRLFSMIIWYWLSLKVESIIDVILPRIHPNSTYIVQEGPNIPLLFHLVEKLCLYNTNHLSMDSVNTDVGRDLNYTRKWWIVLQIQMPVMNEVLNLFTTL